MILMAVIMARVWVVMAMILVAVIMARVWVVMTMIPVAVVMTRVWVVAMVLVTLVMIMPTINMLFFKTTIFVFITFITNVVVTTLIIIYIFHDNRCIGLHTTLYSSNRKINRKPYTFDFHSMHWLAWHTANINSFYLKSSSYYYFISNDMNMGNPEFFHKYIDDLLC